MIKNKVLLGVTGSIAACKSFQLAKELEGIGYDVDIILSESAPTFINLEEFQQHFDQKLYFHDCELNSNEGILHINLAKSAKYILIAPASANMIAKLAHGMANCLLSTVCLATKAQIILAPAMNKQMWENKIVQRNIKILQTNGFRIIEPAIGAQACGDYGKGRMQEVKDIVGYMKSVNPNKIFANKKIVITSGPTKEKIDPVRFISNYSSGKMGCALAETALDMGAEVVLISGSEITPGPHDNLKLITVESSDEMYKQALQYTKNAEVFIGAAAVADYKPLKYSSQKVKKDNTLLNLKLCKNVDIISEVKKSFPKVFCVGFAAETHNSAEFGQRKLLEKKLDMIAINDVAREKVFFSNYNKLQVLSKSGKIFNIPRSSKAKVAIKLLEIIYQSLDRGC